jgi:hypothetical protein
VRILTSDKNFPAQLLVILLTRFQKYYFPLNTLYKPGLILHFFQISAGSKADFISRITEEFFKQGKKGWIEFREKRPKIQGIIPY